MKNYAPTPGTLPFRALAHMALLHKGSEISNPTLAIALGVGASGELIKALQPAVAAGMIFARQKGGHLRSPVFWSLVDHSAGVVDVTVDTVHAAPVTAPRAALWPPAVETLPRPSPAKPPAPYLDDDAAPRQVVTKVQSGDADPLIRETVQNIATANPLQAWASIKYSDDPEPASDGIDIDDVHRTRDGFIDMEHTEGRDSQQVLKAEPATADATDRENPADASPSVGSMGAGQAADAAAPSTRTNTRRELITPESAPSEAAPARHLASEGEGTPNEALPMRLGVFDNRTLHVVRRGVLDVWSVAHFRQLLRFLDSISLESVREGEA